MMEDKPRTRLLLIISFLLINLFCFIVPAHLLDFENNNYTIKLLEDGSAVWVIESSTFLDSEEDLQAFKSYIENFDAYRREVLENFTSRIEKIVTEASRYVNRPMKAVDFNVSVYIVDTLVGKVGRLTYTFKWIGFSETKNGKLVVGDVFIGGFYLYEGDSLKIIIPETHSFEEVHPQPDTENEDAVTWLGRKLFPDKTPYIVASTRTVTEEILTNITGSSQTSSTIFPSGDNTIIDGTTVFWRSLTIYPLIVLIAAVVIIVGILLKKRGERRFTVKDADKVVEILRELGGSAFQKQLVEKTGFSKGKVSEILSALEKNKVIEKVRVGRSQLVILKKK